MSKWNFLKPAKREGMEMAAGYYLAIKSLIDERGYKAISLKDVDGMKKLLGFPPAPIFMLLADCEGVSTIPENDCLGNVTQLIVNALTGQCGAYLEFYEFFENSVLAGSEIPVTVYTNCDELELFLNEKSLGKKQIEKYGHGEWDVKYEAGELKVLGYIRGQKVCEHKRTTTGKPVGLKLTLDNEFEPNGKDIALFTCECIDEFGNTVPDASPLVDFSVESPAVVIGTGSDNCDHNNVTLPSRKMYMGKIRVAVKPAKNQKKLKLFAFSENYKSDVLELVFQTFE